jgi:hypothetical protein
MKNEIHLETSYAYDIDIVNKLYQGVKSIRKHLLFAMAISKSLIQAG